MVRRLCVAIAFFALSVSGEDIGSASGAEENTTELVPQVNRTLEELRFPVLFGAIVNRSVVLEHFAETHDLRVSSIEEETVVDLEVELEADASTVKSCNTTAKPCSVEANNTEIDENALPPPSLQPTDRLVRVDDLNVSILSFQDVIDSPVGSVAVLPLFKPVGSARVLSGFARVEIISPKMLEFEPATPQRKEVITAWEKLAEERRVAEGLARKEQELLEKLDKEEYERTRMTPHNLATGKRRDGWEFRYEVEFTTKGPIGLYWDLNTRDNAV
ncbi:hypothetical protein F442_11341, partial [Phytophthora nicotianae P10297]